MNDRSVTRRFAAKNAGVAERIEWPTVTLIASCYGGWLVAGWLYAVAPIVSVLLLATTILLHSSLQHEAIHRHPTRHAGWNEALVWLPLGVMVPYRRFREQHLAHHIDSHLTDPYDDPESFYFAPGDWERFPRAMRKLLTLNNVLAARMLIGPLVSTVFFLRAEAAALIRPGENRRAVRLAWAHHLAGLVALALIMKFVLAVPVAIYLLSAYLARSVLAVRSFCEHQWAEQPGARTVIVERSLLGWLFLNNNLHVVHHTHPGIAWYALPAAYHARRTEWQAVNNGYVFRGYGAVLRKFAWRAKEPVAHPAHEFVAAP